MNLLADENIERQLVARLRSEGHTVPYVAEMAPGLDDEAVLREASQSGALLLTSDKDFGELAFRQHQLGAGVVLIRLPGVRAEARADIVVSILRERGSELEGSFSVISAGAVRIRKRP